MFGAFLRGAAAFVLGILLWTPLDTVISAALDNFIEPNLGADSTTAWALQSAVQQWPLILLFIIATGIIARSIVESNVGRAPR